ncbi:MAG: hypothetical protein M3R37_12675 [Actinomycetota bacterium]|nr:hypothetical protein [Actinomycetota bacterium]
MTTDLEAIGRDLEYALERRLRNKRRRSHRLRLALLSLAATGAFATVAYASGIAGDLQLDPTKWSILGGGTVDNNRGAYVHAKNRGDGSNSTFMVEHDSGLPAYQAFLLHQKTLAAANSTSPVPVRSEAGALCTPGAVTRAETVAMATLRAGFVPGTSPDATRAAVTAAVAAAFENAPCAGLEYAGEQARLVYSGRQPESTLMPGAR